MIMIKFKKKNSGMRVVYNLANIDLHEDTEGSYIVARNGICVRLDISYEDAAMRITHAINNHYRFLKDGVK